jgi:hypothetical protein
MAYSKRDWEKLIRKLSLDESNVFFSVHGLQQMKTRRITRDMALDVLLKGNIQIEPEPNIKTGHITCRMQRFTAGKNIGVVVACEDESASCCLIVTAFIIGD